MRYHLRPVTFVLDRHALDAYARRLSLAVPSLLASVVERGHMVMVSALALSEAYRDLSPEHAGTLDLLTAGELANFVTVAPFDHAAARYAGRRAATGEIRDLVALHTAALAAQHAATVVTSDRATTRRLLGPEWPILEV